MRILCLILASDTSPEYIRFQSLWKKFMHLHPDVDCYFYKGHPDLTQPSFLEDQTFWIKVPETFETIYEKTLKAFEACLPILGKYDFVYRSNLSTFVSFKHMLKYCEDLPRTNCCAAVTGGIPPSDTDRNSLKYPRSFPGGNGFILSPDLVHRIVDEKEPLDTQDDITIGNALRRWGIEIREFVRPDYDGNSWFINNLHLLESREQSFEPKKKMFTYRLKSTSREKDIEMMEHLIKKYYTL